MARTSRTEHVSAPPFQTVVFQSPFEVDLSTAITLFLSQGNNKFNTFHLAKLY